MKENKKVVRDKGLILYTKETEFIAQQIYNTMKAASTLLNLEYEEAENGKEFTAIEDGSGFVMLTPEELVESYEKEKRYIFALLPIITYSRSMVIQIDTVLQHAIMRNVRYYDRNGTIYEPTMTYKSENEEDEL